MSGTPRKRSADDGTGTPSKKQKMEMETDASGKLSFREAAVEILRRHQKPLTAKEISDIMLTDNMVETTGKTPDRTLAAQMYTEINKKAGTSLFCKAGPGLFALREFWTGGDDGEGMGTEAPERKTPKRTPAKKAKSATPKDVKASTSIASRRAEENVRPIGQHAAQRTFNPNECALCHECYDKANLVRHPIVGNLKVMFCVTCADEITKLRRFAQEKGYLQFPGELNEEICKLCSKGTPEQPIHLNCCDMCESAYCNDCVSTIFGNDEFRRMSEKDQWSCPLCRRKQKKAREALRAAAAQSGGVLPATGSPAVAASTSTPPPQQTAPPPVSMHTQSAQSLPQPQQQQQPAIDEAEVNGGELEINTAEPVAPKARPGSPSALAASTNHAAKEGRGTLSSTNNDSSGAAAENTADQSVDTTEGRHRLVNEANSRMTSGDSSSKKQDSLSAGTEYAYLYWRYYLDLTSSRKASGEEDDCFVCKNGGNSLLCCSYPGCKKVYHKDCLQLESLPNEGWVCPHHSCCDCRKQKAATAATADAGTESTGQESKSSDALEPSVFRCVTCPNAYCEAHKPAKDTVKMLRDNKLFCADCLPFVKNEMLALCDE